MYERSARRGRAPMKGSPNHTGDPSPKTGLPEARAGLHGVENAAPGETRPPSPSAPRYGAIRVEIGPRCWICGADTSRPLGSLLEPFRCAEDYWSDEIGGVAHR